jgi:hypothetical protein
VLGDRAEVQQGMLRSTAGPVQENVRTPGDVLEARRPDGPLTGALARTRS